MGLSAHLYKAVMGATGPMGHCGPALCKGAAAAIGQCVRGIFYPGRISRTLQVVVFQWLYAIRPGRPPPPRTGAHAGAQACVCVGAGARAYARATRFHWTSGRKVNK
jgi:hypothetical protein